MGTPSRFTYGVTNVSKDHQFGMMKSPVPQLLTTYFNDFGNYVAGDWTITTVGTGTSALTNVDGGALLITNSAANGDSRFHDKVGEMFLPASGKRMFFEARFTVSDASLTAWVMGLQVTDTTPLDVTDGMYFIKSSATTNINFIVGKDATTGRLTSSSVTTNSAAGTYMKLSFYFDGNRYITLWKDDVEVYTVDLTTTLTTYLPDTTLTVSFGIQNGEAVAKTMTVDYIFAAKER
jgi:hypothetical protein